MAWRRLVWIKVISYSSEVQAIRVSEPPGSKNTCNARTHARTQKKETRVRLEVMFSFWSSEAATAYISASTSLPACTHLWHTVWGLYIIEPQNTWQMHTCETYCNMLVYGSEHLVSHAENKMPSLNYRSVAFTKATQFQDPVSSYNTKSIIMN